jgi:hypothetical protein
MPDRQRIEASGVNSQSFFGSHAAMVSTTATMSATQVRAADGAPGGLRAATDFGPREFIAETPATTFNGPVQFEFNVNSAKRSRLTWRDRCVGRLLDQGMPGMNTQAGSFDGNQK